MVTDLETSKKFSNSWNNVYNPSVYTYEQVSEWISPWNVSELEGQSVLELGCGSGAILYHLQNISNIRLSGIDLGSSVNTARKLLHEDVNIIQSDITDHKAILSLLGRFDRCYCIGVLHHLCEPQKGFESLLKLTKPGGYFHAWVYAYEGNWVVRIFVEPLRIIVNQLPWWLNKFLIALPLSIPFYFYGKLCSLLKKFGFSNLSIPLFDYMIWVSKRDFRFHHHVAFDQLVTPTTHYFKRGRIEKWLEHPEIDPSSIYIKFRNGNGWKFGGRIKN
jgi:SAM-dependent methyltransferase